MQITCCVPRKWLRCGHTQCLIFGADSRNLHCPCHVTCILSYRRRPLFSSALKHLPGWSSRDIQRNLAPNVRLPQIREFQQNSQVPDGPRSQVNHQPQKWLRPTQTLHDVQATGPGSGKCHGCQPSSAAGLVDKFLHDLTCCGENVQLFVGPGVLQNLHVMHTNVYTQIHIYQYTYHMYNNHTYVCNIVYTYSII